MAVKAVGIRYLMRIPTGACGWILAQAALPEASVSGGHATGDSITNFENVKGSAFGGRSGGFDRNGWRYRQHTLGSRR